MIFEWKLKGNDRVSHVDLWEEPSGVNRGCKGPEARKAVWLELRSSMIWTKRQRAGRVQILLSTQGSAAAARTLALSWIEMRSHWGGLSKGVIGSGLCLSGSLLCSFENRIRSNRGQREGGYCNHVSERQYCLWRRSCREELEKLGRGKEKSSGWLC